MENELIYTHVLNRGGKGVRSPVDSLWIRTYAVLCGIRMKPEGLGSTRTSGAKKAT
jgi:hypothetical protein